MDYNRVINTQSPSQKYYHPVNQKMVSKLFLRAKCLSFSLRTLISIISKIILATNQNFEIEPSYQANSLKELAYNKMLEDTNTRKILEFFRENGFDYQKFLNVKDGQFFAIEELFACNLTNFFHLDFAELDIDDIPEIICKKLENLNELNLSKNPRISLKSKWFQVLGPKLEVLDISYCDLNHDDFKLLLENCKNLSVLNISGNPNIDLSNVNEYLQNITELHASDISLKEDGLRSIMKLTNLKVLGISSNYLFEAYKKIVNFENVLSSLETLNLSNTGLRIEDMAKIRELCNLIQLDISKNNLDDNIENQNLHKERINPKKRKLNDRSTQNGTLVKCSFLGPLTDKLTDLNVSQTNISKHTLKEIFSCTKLEKIDASKNNLSNLNTDKIDFSSKESVKEINISDCSLKSSELLKHILALPNIEKIDASKNILYIFDFDNENCQSKLSLKSLNLKGNKLKIEEVLIRLSDFSCIEHLDLSENSTGGYRNIEFQTFFSDPNNQTSSALPGLVPLQISLKELFLKNNRIEMDNQFLLFITSCLNLETLDISGNKLSDIDDKFEFGSSSKSLKRLCLSACLSQGDNILRQIFHFLELKYLDLSDNIFLTLPNNLESLPFKYTLTDLIIGYNRIDLNDLMKVISQCNKLENLDISRLIITNIGNDFDFGICALTLRNLKASHLNANKLNLLFSKILTQFKILEELDLSGSNLYNISINEIHNCVFLERLKKLRIEYIGRNISELSNLLGKCKSLDNLDLQGIRFNNLTNDFIIGDDLKHSLRKLKLRFVIRDSKLVKEFMKCENLAELRFWYGEISNFSSGKFRNSLKKLVIYYGEITSKTFKEFSNFPRLKYLEFSGFATKEENFKFKFGCSKESLETLKITFNWHRFNLSKTYLLELTSCSKLKQLILNGLINFQEEDYNFGISSSTLQDITISGYFSDSAFHSIKSCIDKFSLLSNNYPFRYSIKRR